MQIIKLSSTDSKNYNKQLIAEHYKPEEIIGQQVSLLVNLAPREIKGILSQGMILMSENSDGKLTFVAPVDKHSNGSVIK